MDQRYLGLDALRGIAALSVMVYHFTQVGSIFSLPFTSIAVDFFFCLSGFVLAHAYLEKIHAGMHLSQFLMIRLIRLYPIYLISLAIGIIGFFMLPEDVVFRLQEQSVNLIRNGLILLPFPNTEEIPFAGGNNNGVIFPINPPAWSLFFEIFINLFYFSFPIRNKRVLTSIVVLAGMVYAAMAWNSGVAEGGWGSANFLMGFPRVMFGFYSGVLIYLLHTGGHLKSYQISPIVLGAILVLIFALPRNEFMLAWHLLLMLIVVPVLLSVSISAVVEPGYAGLCRWLGMISFPVYLIHFPVYRILENSVWVQSMWGVPLTDSFAFLIFSILSTIIISNVIVHWVELPIRVKLIALVGAEKKEYSRK